MVGATQICVPINFGGGLASLTLFYYRVLGLAPAARPLREHFVFVFFVPGKSTLWWLSNQKIGLNATFSAQPSNFCWVKTTPIRLFVSNFRICVTGVVKLTL